MSTKCLSASALYEELTGASSWRHEADAEAEYTQLDDEELYELMFNDFEVEELAASLNKLNQRARLIVPSPASDSECSICLSEFDSECAKFDCGHKFCNNCVGAYLRSKINEAPRLHHKVSKVTQDDDGIAVSVYDVVGVKCPHACCGAIIDDFTIMKYVDNSTWEKFDRFALDQTIRRLLLTGELAPCPLGCGYFTQEDCLCLNPDCRKKQLHMRKMASERMRRIEIMGLDKFQNWAASNKDLVKLCPNCYVRIEKNGGCDHMFCQSCKKNFLWSGALPFNDTRNPFWKQLKDFVRRPDLLKYLKLNKDTKMILDNILL